MKTAKWISVMFGVLVMAALVAGSFAAGMHTCAVCGMMADEAAPFTAKIEAGKEALYFCDIGDLLIYLKEKKAGRSLARVKDYPSRGWIEAAKAYYVTAPQRFTTPMGWSIAAFRDRKDAEGYGAPVDLESILKGLK